MTVKRYPFNDNHELGTWKYIKTRAGRSAWFTCPECGESGLLTDHVVTDDGIVAPSVVCDCGFHEFIQLEGWQP